MRPLAAENGISDIFRLFSPPGGRFYFKLKFEIHSRMRQTIRFVWFVYRSNRSKFNIVKFKVLLSFLSPGFVVENRFFDAPNSGTEFGCRLSIYQVSKSQLQTRILDPDFFLLKSCSGLRNVKRSEHFFDFRSHFLTIRILDFPPGMVEPLWGVECPSLNLIVDFQSRNRLKQTPSL